VGVLPGVAVVRVAVALDADVVTAVADRAGGGVHPLLGLALPGVGGALVDRPPRLVAIASGDVGGGGHPGDLGRQRRRGVAVFGLPALLRGASPGGDQIVGGLLDVVTIE